MKLDPDERLTARLKESIPTAIRNADRAGTSGLSFHRRLCFMGARLPVRRR